MRVETVIELDWELVTDWSKADDVGRSHEIACYGAESPRSHLQSIPAENLNQRMSGYPAPTSSCR